jgi:hypothetical protein
MSKPFATTFDEMYALLDPKKKIRIYRNLNASHNGEKGFWSVKQGTVKCHCQDITLQNVNFLVNEKVRQRVVLNKRKEVHAYVEGFLAPRIFNVISFTNQGHAVTYNPYTCDEFMCGDAPIVGANLCRLVKVGDSMKVFVDKESLPDTMG